jgi:hypothetical protein
MRRSKRRPISNEFPIAEITRRFQQRQFLVTVSGKKVRKSRVELRCERLVARALEGDVGAADGIIKALKFAKTDLEPGPIVIEIVGGLPPSDGDGA